MALDDHAARATPSTRTPTDDERPVATDRMDYVR
jgi:hypothetical protein